MPTILRDKRRHGGEGSEAPRATRGANRELRVAIEAKASRRFRPEHARGVEAFARSYRGKKRPRTLVVSLGADRLQTPAGTQVLPPPVFLAEMEDDRLFG